MSDLFVKNVNWQLCKTLQIPVLILTTATSNQLIRNRNRIIAFKFHK